MSRVRHCDLKRFSNAIQALQEAETIGNLAPAFIRSLEIIFGADQYTINWVDRTTGDVMAYGTPYPFSEEEVELFRINLHEHPGLPAIQHPENSPVVKWTDFTTLRQFRKTNLYNGVFRGRGIKHQLALAFEAEPGATVCAVLDRRHTAYSEEERTLLQMMAPHFAHAYRQVHAKSLLARTLAVQQACLYDDAVMLVSEGGELIYATELALRWCREYFGILEVKITPLPILRWLAEKRSREDRLTKESGGRQLTIRCAGIVPVPAEVSLRNPMVPERSAFLLRFAESCTEPSFDGLRSLGLTPRETEVLMWMAKGKRNSEIATIIGASPRTVDKHVENIYVKLFVENRSAAVARAWEVLGATGNR